MSQQPPTAPLPERRWAHLAAAALLVALALFGARYHPMEQAGTAERDGFVAQAELLLAGEVPRDPYRPLLYPLAVASLVRLSDLLDGAGTGLDPFTAARLISNLAAALLAWLAFAFGSALAGAGRRPGLPAGPAPGPDGGAALSPGALGLWAMALVAVNPNLWTLGQHAATDMTFGALAAATLLAALGLRRRPTLLGAAGLGCLWGLAAFTRGSALLLLPGLALMVATSPELGWRRDPRGGSLRLGALGGVAALGSLAGLLPHWILRARAFGDPFRDDNWKNLAWKLYGDGDWSYLDRVPFGSLREVVLADPGRVLGGAAAELARFAAGGLSQLLGTPLHALAALGGVAWVVWIACWIPWRTRRRGVDGVDGVEGGQGEQGDEGAAALWLAVACGLFLGGLATLFFTWGRFLLFLLPMAAPFAVLFVAALAAARLPGGHDRDRPPAAGRVPWRRLAASVVLLGLVAVLGLKTFAFRLPDFIAQHPWGERAAARALDRTLPPGTAIAGTAPFLGRELEAARWVPLPDAFGEEVDDPDLWWAQVRRLVEEEGVSVLLASPVELRSRPPSLVAGAGPEGDPAAPPGRSPVPWLEVMEAPGFRAPEPAWGVGGPVTAWRVRVPEPGPRPQAGAPPSAP